MQPYVNFARGLYGVNHDFMPLSIPITSKPLTFCHFATSTEYNKFIEMRYICNTLHIAYAALYCFCLGYITPAATANKELKTHHKYNIIRSYCEVERRYHRKQKTKQMVGGSRSLYTLLQCYIVLVEYFILER